MALLSYWRSIILLSYFASGIHFCFIMNGAYDILKLYPNKNSTFIVVRGQSGQDLSLFCYLLQVLSIISLCVGTPLKLATPVQVASCLFPFLAFISLLDGCVPFFKHGILSLAKFSVATSLVFLSGIAFWIDWALREHEGLPNWGSMGERDREANYKQALKPPWTRGSGGGVGGGGSIHRQHSVNSTDSTANIFPGGSDSAGTDNPGRSKGTRVVRNKKNRARRGPGKSSDDGEGSDTAPPPVVITHKATRLYYHRRKSQQQQQEQQQQQSQQHYASRSSAVLPSTSSAVTAPYYHDKLSVSNDDNIDRNNKTPL